MELLARIDHPNIIALMGAGSKPRPFIILEQLKPLDSVLDMDDTSSTFRPTVHRKRAFSYRDLLLHARSFAAAMMYLHEEADARGMVIHRDLKVRYLGPYIAPYQGPYLARI